MQGEVRELTKTLWAARRPDELMEGVAAIESLKSSLDALVLGMVRELQVTNAVKPVGWASTQDFVTARTGGHKGNGSAVVRLAQAVQTPLLTPVGEAMTDGWLSATRAQVILRAIEHLITVVDPDGEARREERELDREERVAHLGRDLSIRFDGAGGCWINGRSGHGTTETGEDMRAGTIRRLACDAEIIPIVLGSRGEVLDIGRQLRLATPAIWKALVARDRHCRFPNCTRPPTMCHPHHLTHWADGGEASLTNMILLCSHHHRLIHAGPWQIRRTGPNGFAFDPHRGPPNDQHRTRPTRPLIARADGRHVPQLPDLPMRGRWDPRGDSPGYEPRDQREPL